jgi:transposase-like protein
VPKPYPKEFREDVVDVARRREPGQTIKQIAADFGIAESCLRNWMRTAEVEAGLKPGTTAAEHAELREAKKRTRLLRQEKGLLALRLAPVSSRDDCRGWFCCGEVGVGEECAVDDVG